MPDLSDTQVIVATEWMGRNPKLIEDQVTYPITTTFLGAPRVKTARGFTMFGMSLTLLTLLVIPAVHVVWRSFELRRAAKIRVGRLASGDPHETR